MKLLIILEYSEEINLLKRKIETQEEKIKEYLPVTCPKLVRLIENITELDKNDLKKYGKNFKHIIYSDVKSSLAGIKLVASALTAYGMTNVYNSSLKVKLPTTKNNFALLSSVAVYEKPFPVKLRNEILKIFNSRPDNIYGEQIRFLLLDNGFKEGIDVYDMKINSLLVFLKYLRKFKISFKSI